MHVSIMNKDKSYVISLCSFDIFLNLMQKLTNCGQINQGTLPQITCTRGEQIGNDELRSEAAAIKIPISCDQHAVQWSKVTAQIEDMCICVFTCVSTVATCMGTM